MKRKVSFEALTKDIEVLDIVGDENVFVSNVTANSRKVTKGSAFIAVKGFTVDAHEFIEKAIGAGAKVLFGERMVRDLSIKLPSGVTYVQIKNSRKSIGIICANFYNNPAKQMTIIGVTGTDGKTTTCHLLYHVLQKAGISSGMISTLGAYLSNKKIETGLHVTSPDAEDVQYILSVMAKKGITHVVLEVTSHALDQERFSGVPFTIAVLTNITHEHLDYHKTFENYRDTKLKLFLSSKVSILNSDDPSFSYIKHALGDLNVISYGITNRADYNARHIHTNGLVEFTAHSAQFEKLVKTQLIGTFNIYNCLATFAVAHKLQLPLTITTNAIRSFVPPRGRMEEIKNHKGLRIIVDFAHTPNGLEKLLTALKPPGTEKKQLIAVFGSAGERDKMKRTLMGKISGKIASLSVVTAEDPRSETVDEISKEIIRGIESVKGTYVQIDDRGVAIFDAINKYAQKGDTVVICGKGHETSMGFGKTEYNWSDQTAVMYALQDKVLSLKL